MAPRRRASRARILVHRNGHLKPALVTRRKARAATFDTRAIVRAIGTGNVQGQNRAEAWKLAPIGVRRNASGFCLLPRDEAKATAGYNS
jgi:hypothetical protein